MRCRTGRIHPDLRNLLMDRKLKFKTTLTKEQGNLVRFLKEVEGRLGIDFRNIEIRKGKMRLNSKHRIWVMRY